MTGNGIYQGKLSSDFNALQESADKGLMIESQLYPNNEIPASMELSEFHILLIYENELKALSILSGLEEILRITCDNVSRTFWLYSDANLYEVLVQDEDKYNDEQNEEVLKVQGDYYFENERYNLAASYYAQTNIPLEKIAILFYEKEQIEALKTFVLLKLENTSKHEPIQLTLLCTWAVDLYLQLLTTNKAKNKSDEEKFWQEELMKFLSSEISKTYLHPQTTLQLLKKHDCISLVSFYQLEIHDYDGSIEFYLEHNKIKDALKVIQEHKHAPFFFKSSPVEFVNILIKHSEVNVRSIIPATLLYEEKSNEINQVVRYLEFCVINLQNVDPMVHNILINHYSKLKDESVLIKYLKNYPAFHFDLQYGLRCCLQNGKTFASILIYAALHLYEEAIELSIQEETMDENNKILNFRKGRFKNVTYTCIIQRAIELVKEIEIVQFEDILPLLPDFVLIDEIKDELISVLENYGERIDNLERDMESASKNAEAIRLDIRKLKRKYILVYLNQRHITIPMDSLCMECDELINIKEFFAFPCQHCLHTVCLINKVQIFDFLKSLKKTGVH
ncbi:hypothetical protein O9G_005814 [Rozella allomycis CSF55]|uniref:Pep3/Vps18 beta-propeller domain-containing protein n=1 Tax=Rozella allomycis (strain CSF55) TaxID=988480 RepID=A0A075AVY8_ROZAC|nr:hypothetical protein O9G_005814 [Rozella allomycis CSF55]|eukprot:EPZ32877.1 hypothetical protein O9G_005814 [Rozella allomycis CSF55]